MIRRPRLSFEQRGVLLALAAGAPAVSVAVGFVLANGGEGVRRAEAWTVVIAVVAVWVLLATRLHGVLGDTLRTLANLVEAIRARDFSIRAPSERSPGSLGDVLFELNALSVSLREQRLEAAEASALLQTVLGEVDVALFAFDEAARVVLVNAAGERFLGLRSDEVIGKTAGDLGVEPWLDGPAPRLLESKNNERRERWELRRAEFRRHGIPHVLVVLTDVARALRVEERMAWQRLVRVLSHEVNNSLAAIQSVASGQARVLEDDDRAADWEDDLRSGLDLVARRAGSLSRFLSSYAALARLPPPAKREVDVPAWVARVASLETRVPVVVESGPACTVLGDPDQLEALLLNLVKNAAEAAEPKSGGARLRWRTDAAALVVEVEDDGAGIANSGNLFVPFFTTKPSGSGIGLVLCRQIAEAHDGALVLENREQGRGAVARLRLPLR